MMTKSELGAHLAALNLSPAEAAALLGVSTRTLRREVPAAAEAALRAWRILHDRHLPWKPDSVSIFENDQEQLERHRRHAQEIAALIDRVEKRGGAKSPWMVDLAQGTATFGPIEVCFYHLANGGFSLSTYTRKDQTPDINRDLAMIEDSAYCIASAFTKAAQANKALKAVAAYTRDHSGKFARSGAKVLEPAQAKNQKERIESVADEIDKLSDAATRGQARYAQFEASLAKLHLAGFFPTIELVSDVARAMV